MCKGNSTENDIMQCIFNAVPMPDYGASLYVHLHTSDPGEAGTSSSNEADYTGYAAVTVARDSSGFTVSGNQAVNTAAVTFPECAGGANTLTHASVATLGGQILYSGALNGPISVSNLITPRFPAGTMVLTED
jgi:hypothetical protein